MKIQLKFLGSLKYDIKKEKIEIEISPEMTIRDIIRKLLSNPSYIELSSFFSESLELKRSLLLFVNEQEISALAGMSTKLKEKDVLSFIPVIHGG
ncbi:MoaD/ThiS family protein [Candidatus Hodarchaeum mangrovi]